MRAKGRMPPMLRSLTIRFLLVFALLSAQFGGLAHGIEHTLFEQSQDQSLPHDKYCDLCATYAQIGSAIGSSIVHFDFSSAFAESSTAFSSACLSATFSAFAARAPPYSV